MLGSYRGQNVLVTGLTGFKGVWLATWLSRRGAIVRGLALPPTSESRVGWPGIDQRFDCVHVDVRDVAGVERAVAEFRPSIIFHLAAQALVRTSYDDPVGTFATNVLGTVHVLEAARRCDSVRCVVCVTSDKCYENREWLWGYRETEAMGGHDPYSASKGCAEIVTSAYERSYAKSRALRIASARAGNVIGGGDWAANRLVPDMVRGLITGSPVMLRRPDAVRPWQHVLEVLSGYLMLGAAISTSPTFCGPWNFGPENSQAVTVRELAKMVCRCWGPGSVVEDPDSSMLHEALQLKLDSTKARALLGWRPLLSMEERIAWSIDWYRTWQQRPDNVWETSAKQIDDYEARLITAGIVTEKAA